MKTVLSMSDVYLNIKNGLSSGEYAAGNKLKPDIVRTQFGISTSAMREVLLRLSAEGHLILEENRGFHVPPASPKLLLELMDFRILIECSGAELSIRNGDIEWEARLNAAHHKLAHLEQKMHEQEDIFPLLPVWTRTDSEFHETLLSACNSQLLLQTRHNIHERSRQQVVAVLPGYGFRSATVKEHGAILEAALSRNVSGVQQAIENHLDCFRDGLEAIATKE